MGDYFFSVATAAFPDAIAVVDGADRDLVCDGNGRWRATKCGRGGHVYVCRHRTGSGRDRDERLHRMILGVTDPLVLVDHRNGDTFDCRRSNLRPASHRQNIRNRRISSGRSLPKGVVIHGGRFRAKITVDQQCLHLGLFDTAAEAALAYDSAARKYFGEFARTNQEIEHVSGLQDQCWRKGADHGPRK